MLSWCSFVSNIFSSGFIKGKKIRSERLRVDIRENIRGSGERKRDLTLVSLSMSHGSFHLLLQAELSYKNIINVMIRGKEK